VKGFLGGLDFPAQAEGAPPVAAEESAHASRHPAVDPRLHAAILSARAAFTSLELAQPTLALDFADNPQGGATGSKCGKATRAAVAKEVFRQGMPEETTGCPNQIFRCLYHTTLAAEPQILKFAKEVQLRAFASLREAVFI